MHRAIVVVVVGQAVQYLRWTRMYGKVSLLFVKYRRRWIGVQLKVAGEGIAGGGVAIR